jgi:hypothetical protein
MNIGTSVDNEKIYYEEYLLRKAIVIDIDDPDKQGKIKVKVMPDNEGITDDSLFPWAMPFSSYNSSKVMSNDPFEVNSKVRILIRTDWQRFYYLGNRYQYSNFTFDTITSLLNNISSINNKEYKNLRFRLYLDGSLDFHNNSTGEHGYIHSNGSYYFMDKDGYLIYTDSKGNIIKNSSSGINITDSNNNTLVMNSSGIILNNHLKVTS